MNPRAPLQSNVRTQAAISVVILTFNSAKTISRTLASVAQISDDIHVVDSHSDDNTIQICRSLGCKVTERAFQNYSEQRNWAIDNLQLLYDWQMHVDADEELEPDLIKHLLELNLEVSPYDGFIIGRKIVVFGRVLRFGGIAKTWHCRLFRNGTGRCEVRLYDQHFICSGETGVINAFMLDHQENSLSDWTARHNRWSDLEAAEVVARADELPFGQIIPRADGNFIERRRYHKKKYYSLPLFFRALGYFFYRYFFLFGFLDGVEGLIYHVLQGLWFRFLVDAKLYELRRLQTRTTADDEAVSILRTIWRRR